QPCKGGSVWQRTFSEDGKVHDPERSLRPPNRCRYASAELAFDSGTSQYCLISHEAEPEDLLETIVCPEWGLRSPNLILSIMGGAG
ncbi:Trpm2, partial [Symbiodinium pilosum]